MNRHQPPFTWTTPPLSFRRHPSYIDNMLFPLRNTTAAWKTLLAILMICLAPVEALCGPPDKIISVEVQASDENGKKIIGLRLEGGLTVTAEGGLTLDLRFEDSALDLPQFGGDMAGQARLDLDSEQVRLDSLNLDMPKARITLEGGQNATADLSMTAKGDYVFKDGRLDISGLSLSLDKTLKCAGSMSYDSNGLEANMHTDSCDPSALFKSLRNVLPPFLSEASVSNLPSLSLGLKNTEGPLEVELDLKNGLTAGLNKASILKIPPLTAKLTMDSGESGNWTLDCGLEAKGDLSWNGMGLGNPTIGLSAARRGTSTKITALRVEMSGMHLGKNTLPLRNISGSGSMTELLDGGLRLEEAQLALPGIGDISAWAMIDANKGLTKGQLTGKGLNMAGLGPLLAGAAGKKDAGQWTFAGKADLEALVQGLDDEPELQASLDFSQVSYSSPDAENMAENLAGSLKISSPLVGEQELSAKAVIDTGEVLSGTSYLNMKKNPLAVDARGVLREGMFTDSVISTVWTGYGRADLRGNLGADRMAGNLKVRDVNLSKFFETFVDSLILTSAGGQGPKAHGTAELDMKIHRSGGITDLDGSLKVRDAGGGNPDQGISVQGLALVLPIAYRFGAEPEKAKGRKPEVWGLLTIDKYSSPFLNIEDFSLPLAVVPNRMYFGKDMVLPLLGGNLILNNVQCSDPMSENLQVEMSVFLDGLNLAELPVGKVPLEGSLGGRLDRVVLNRESLETSGSISGDLFGGILTVENIRAAKPLASERQLGLDAHLKMVDLERVSTALGIGRITGRFNLDINDLLVAFGQPAAFEVRGESIESDDADQSVSLKAVNTLSVIGTGSGIGDLGTGLFASWFKEFSYRYIGFHCVLENDIFRIRGLLTEGGVEYIIKKPFFSGIDVVNGNPNNIISFSDMLERVQRVLKPDAASTAPPDETIQEESK